MKWLGYACVLFGLGTIGLTIFLTLSSSTDFGMWPIMTGAVVMVIGAAIIDAETGRRR